MTDTIPPDPAVWFVTGTARAAAKVTAALGERDNLLAVSLDVTDPAAAQSAVDAAVDAAVERFGRVDTLVNNAGNLYAGSFVDNVAGFDVGIERPGLGRGPPSPRWARSPPTSTPSRTLPDTVDMPIERA